MPIVAGAVLLCHHVFMRSFRETHSAVIDAAQSVTATMRVVPETLRQVGAVVAAAWFLSVAALVVAIVALVRK